MSDAKLSREPAAAPSAANAPPASAHDRFVGHANLMSFLTIISRVFGLLRDKLCATYLGNKTTEWSAFWMGFQLPNLFRRIFGEGALTAIFVPIYTRTLHEKGQAEATRLASATVSLLVLVLGGLTILGEAVMLPILFTSNPGSNGWLAALMIAIMLPYCVMVCLVALLGAIATVHEKFIAQSISPIILNLFMAAAAAIPAWYWLGHHPGQILHLRDLRSAVTWVAVAVIAAGVVQVLQMLPTLRRSGVHLRPGLKLRDPALAEIVRSMVPMILGLSAVQFNTYMDTQIAWWLSPDGHKNLHQFIILGWTIPTPMDTGAVGILSVAQRLYMLPVGIFGVSMATAIFPQMSKAAANRDNLELKRLLVAGLRKTLFISLPATVGMMLLAKPLITIIYSHEGLERSTNAAIWFCAGIWAFEAQMVILRAFYALSDRITPMKVAVGMVILNFSLNLILVWFLQEGGIALSTTISAALQSCILLVILRKRLGRLGLRALRPFVWKSLLATALMAFAAYDALWIMTPHLPDGAKQLAALVFFTALVQLPVVLAVAIVTYVLAAYLLGLPDLKDLPVLGKILRRFSTVSPQS